METKDQVDIGLKIVGIIGGLLAAFKVLYELQESRRQKAKDLRWNQANSARELINQMLGNELAYNATIMFDWSGREFKISPKEVVTIEFQDVINALRTTDLQFTEKEVFIRDCVDAFLFQVEFIEQAISNGLIEFRDIRFPMEYFIKTINDHKILLPLKEFIQHYKYKNSNIFIGRFGL